MAESDYDVRVIPALLDRLIDHEPRSSREVLPTRSESVRLLKRSVQRDLENLLNTRNPHGDLPAGFQEAARSVLCYGLADFSALNVKSPADNLRLKQIIESAIRFFEPRLGGVQVSLIPADAVDRSLRFRVDARLLLQPVPEPVSFDMILQLNNQRYQVREAGT